MDEKELKTSTKQRVVIIIIAVLMLGSIIASYAAIILNGGKAGQGQSTSSDVSEEKIAELEAAYDKKEAEFKEATKSDFEKFVKYKSEIVAYNEVTANSVGVQRRDLKVGSGRELTEGDTNYLAYYVGWCADETIFDSTFDDSSNPTGFVRILDASLGMIEGWNTGVIGMKIGGIREVTMAGEVAYQDKMEICGGFNKPLKFLIMAKENTGDLAKLAKELDEANMRLQYAYYGIDYDAVGGE